MPTCEYCGDEFAKGGAYATHVRYCDARPNSESRAESTDQDSVSGDDARGEGDEGITVEISDRSSEARSGQAVEESGTEAAATERERIAEPQGTEGPDTDAVHITTDDYSSRRWIAVLGLALGVLILWRVLRSTGD